MIAMAALEFGVDLHAAQCGRLGGEGAQATSRRGVGALIIGGVSAEGGVFPFGGVIEVDVKDPWPGHRVERPLCSRCP